ncbi:inosine-5-monophosphate dehydrogenase [Falsochrobactrum shanghaiense]|uniref:Inosine-5-monophosphate dehydrogenase n=1 Tax=Falsochrobactrum shanghaiense TaxID=2201899 RepID=A0A316J8E2_9HYPH|nr:CBS domain-containing protein [Falsochrobactrum shanghaiense]PWL18222.1 inosine-5-monophosphate dehydrogenase [Falsochrobactrum shanghaiense]
MTVRSILELKGRDVVVIRPDETLAQAIAVLNQYKIGALVVCDAAGQIGGILSERDVVRAIAAMGSAAVERPLSEFMSASVQKCREHHTINQVMEIMTRSRFRHMPVEENGKLVGIVSIGDVVKRRIEDVEREAEDIRTYIATA